MASDADESPLFKACRGSSEEAVAEVRRLIEAGADVRRRAGPFGWTALHEAAGHGALGSVDALLDAGAEVDAPADDGETPLHIASQEGQSKAVQLLVARRANLDSTNEDGETPLLVAVQHIGSKHLAHLELLLSLRADPGAKTSSGQDAFAVARVYTNRGDELVHLLERAQGGAGGGSGADAQRQQAFDQATGGVEYMKQAIFKACREGKADCLRQLLTWAPDGAVATAQAALAPAAAAGHTEIVETLLAARANLHQGADAVVAVRAGAGKVDHVGTTPLIAAAGEGSIRMVRWLLKQGCDASAASGDGATPLMAAAIKGADEAAAALLAARADVNQCSGAQGWTALLAACQAGHPAVARRLLDARADLEYRSAEAGTARELAVANGHAEVVKALDQRARINERQKSRASTGNAGGNAEEDTRDLDEILRGLGEDGGGGKSSSSGKASRGKPAAKGRAAAKAKAAAPTVAAGAAAASPPEPAAARPAPAAAAAEDAAPALAPTESREEAEGRGDEEERLRKRLEEIEALRAKLDAEELQIRRRLDHSAPNGRRRQQA